MAAQAECISLPAGRCRASVRTWLYRVATSRCLDALRSARRRPPISAPPPAGLEPPGPTRLGELLWLEPCPDALLEELADSAPGPEARYEARESISLAFITALQLLPPRQRAAIILRDVLGFHAREAARMLDTTDESVTSALKRARAALERHQQSSPQREPAPPAGSAAEQQLAAQFLTATVFRPGWTARLIPTRANGQPALASTPTTRRPAISPRSG
jgi:RNA polymerase sigma factor (sigma-70 family)